MTKKGILSLSLSLSLLLIFLMMMGSTRACSWGTLCDSILTFLEPIGPLLFIGIPTLLFSLITYKMPQKVFEHWMGFAVWAAPSIMVFSVLIHSDRSGGLMSGSFDALLYIILYGIFCGISIWRIVSKYRHVG